MADCIEKEIELEAPLSRVWRAITDYRDFGQLENIERHVT